ncbi:lycopene cyclase [Lentzea pudingi]|uniref:Lycopene cyclase n=1 Tax=Lentzea pudingi TaxID=1789439 RepID=A0ABQ2HR95_9PSEU|nr:lycopene cyclase domain-containing protein [Lentzea pudingi]GGM87733.1 lycopene cyclase [Lentzea pudingi]
MRSQFEYLAVMGGCVLITLPLEWLGRGVYRRGSELARSIAPVLLVLAAWDVVAIMRGHWNFHPEATTGVRIGVLPIEEIVFFVVIPVCAVLTYEAVRGQTRGWLRDG